MKTKIFFTFFTLIAFACTTTAQTTDDERYEQALEYCNNKEYDKWLAIIKDLVEKNHTGALNSMGVAYYNGWGVAKDYKKAKEFYEKSASLGNSHAFSNLGDIYQYGNGVEKDFNKAKDYYLQAAEKGSVFGMTKLGWLYLNEEYQDLHSEDDNFWDYCNKQAEKWFRDAAKTGDKEGIYELGRYYFQDCSNYDDYGIGIERSFPIFEKAAKMKHGGAQLFMGCLELYQIWANDEVWNKEKKPASIDAAMSWFEQAEENKDYRGWLWFDLNAGQWQIICKFLKDNVQYKIEWGTDICGIWPLAYADEDLFYVGVYFKDDFGFVKVSKDGKMLAHTPFIYDRDGSQSYFDKDTKLFHVYQKEQKSSHEITIDITGKEITSN
ncbi:MAG: tetratricopeptide repeat protein [Lachnospiraceae bacterium]|nr:tetratricopeptide repeat protein [Lachnospiraceae bacterium]